MNSPNSARDISIKKEELEDHPQHNQRVKSRLQVKMNSPDPARDIAIKQEEHEDHPQHSVVDPEEPDAMDLVIEVETESDLSESDDDQESPVNSQPSQSDHTDTDLDEADEEWTPRKEHPITFESDTESDGAEPTTHSRPLSSTKRGGRGAPFYRRGGGLPAEPGWSQTDWNPRDIEFTAVPGPASAAAALQSQDPVDFLELFLTDELLLRIAEQTNLYAAQCIPPDGESTPHARANAWKPTNVAELKHYFGLHFLTAIIHKPEIEMYWSVDEMLVTPFFNKTMSRNRFQLIWRFLHFTDNSNVANLGADKLRKIRPVLDYVVSKFREMYIPDKNISVDEGTLLYRGRLHFKIFNRQKTERSGIKTYVLSDLATGYCFNMKPYCREPAVQVETVEFLLDGLAGFGYRLFMGNITNSVEMCDRMLELNTHVCGKNNRGGPQCIRRLTDADLNVGDSIAMHNDKVMFLGWRDKSIIRMVSTFHQGNMETVEVWQRHRSVKVSKEKPDCIVEHHQRMNGIDKLHRHIAYYPFMRKTNKWTNKFAAYLFAICMFNAFVIYQAKNPQGRCKYLVDFMQSVIRSWTSVQAPQRERRRNRCEEMGSGDAEGVRVRNAPWIEPDPRAPRGEAEGRLDVTLGHLLVTLQPTRKKARPTKRCRLCNLKGLRSETRTYCPVCRMPLHHDCFPIYHTDPNL